MAVYLDIVNLSHAPDTYQPFSGRRAADNA
jgi:hypothetical protein